VAATAAGLGDDGRAWRRTYGPLVRAADGLVPELLGPVVHAPRHPFALARFGLPGLRSARGFGSSTFRGDEARALFAGMAAHSMLALEQPLSAAFGLAFGLFGQAYGWPMASGGSQRITDALVATLEDLGGELVTGHRVATLTDLPPSRAILLDVTPRQLVAIAGDRLSTRQSRRLSGYRYGPGVFKLDWALSGPVPWGAAGASRAATVHLGGSLDEIAASEAEVTAGRHPERPFVLFVQQTPWDPSRAPAGSHTGWAYCHVPNGSTVDMTERIEAQVERFAPGFRDLILARSVRSPADLEAYDANYVGGDINGGVQDWRQLVFRPVPRLDPYAIGSPGLYLCSSSTPPGGGVHGMAGHLAARSALRHELR
jgi:phytoene dehydrogenase-like protein